MIGIELNQGIGRIEAICVELAAGEKRPIHFPRTNWPPARFSQIFHTRTGEELTAARFILAPGEINPIQIPGTILPQ